MEGGVRGEGEGELGGEEERWGETTKREGGGDMERDRERKRERMEAAGGRNREGVGAGDLGGDLGGEKEGRSVREE